MELLSNKWVQIVAGGYLGSAAVFAMNSDVPSFSLPERVMMGLYTPVTMAQLASATGQYKLLLPVVGPIAGAWAAYTYGPVSMNPWILTVGAGAATFFIMNRMSANPVRNAVSA